LQQRNLLLTSGNKNILMRMFFYELFFYSHSTRTVKLLLNILTLGNYIQICSNFFTLTVLLKIDLNHFFYTIKNVIFLYY
jgi:hypothetical protein